MKLKITILYTDGFQTESVTEAVADQRLKFPETLEL